MFIKTIDLYQEVHVYQEVRRCLLRVDVYDCPKRSQFTKRSTQRSTFITARGGASTGARRSAAQAAEITLSVGV